MFPKKRKSLWQWELPLLSRWRPFPLYELVSYLLMFAAVPMLAYGLRPYSMDMIYLLIATELALYIGFFGAILWNDVTDAEIDKIVHPNRPIPKGRVSWHVFFVLAVLSALLVLVFSTLISPWCLLVVGVNTLFVGTHNKFLKKRVKIPAYSEIFTPLQWLTVVFFGFVAVWARFPASSEISISSPVLGQLSLSLASLGAMLVLILFVYFADDAHDLAEGIHDVDGDRTLGVQTYATSFGLKTTSRVSFVMVLLSGLFGVWLWWATMLSPVFLVCFIALLLWALRWSWRLINTREPEMRAMGKEVGRKGFDYLLLVFDVMFLDILWQVIAMHLNLI